MVSSQKAGVTGYKSLIDATIYWNRSESLPSLTPEALANVRIKSPIQQNMIGRSGIFMCRKWVSSKQRCGQDIGIADEDCVASIEKKKALTMKEWFDKCQQKVFK
jgi:hypothetical protein